MDKRNALLRQQYGHPRGKSIHRNSLKNIEKNQHDCPWSIAVSPNLRPPTIANGLVLSGLWWWQITAQKGPSRLFHPGGSNFGFLGPTASGVPARGFRQLRLE